MISDIVKIQLLGNSKGCLDVAEDTAFPIIYSAAEIRDLSSKSGNTSKTIQLADTPNNHKLLNYYFEVNTVAGTFNINEAVPCMVLRNGVPIMDNCVFQLVKVNKMQENSNDEQHAEYEAVVKDQTSDFFTKLGNAELTDLKLDDLDHTYNSTNVIASFANTQANGYKYLMPVNDTSVFNLNDFRPAVYAKTYFDRIFAAAGFSYQWDELTNIKTQFDKLVVPYNGEVPKIREELKQFYRVEANNLLGTQSVTATAGDGAAPPVLPFKMAIPNETLDASGSFTPGAVPSYLSPLYYLGGGAISFNIKFAWDVILDNTTGSTAYAVANGQTMKYRPMAYLGKNASLTNGGFANMYDNGINGFLGGEIELASGYSIPAGQTTLQSGISDINFAGVLSTNTTTYAVAAGCGVTNGIFAKWRATNVPAGAEVKVNTILRIRALQVVIQPSMSELGFGQRIYMNDFIPNKVKQSDFIKSILTHQNLMVSVDQFNSNKLILKSRDKFYDDGVNVDWRLKLCKDKPQQEVFLPSLTTKKIQLSFKPDSDEPNKTYSEATDETYGQVEFMFDSQHVKGTERKELIFSPTPVTKNTAINAVVPMLVGAAPKCNIRLLYDGGQLTCNTYTIVDYVNSSGNNVGTTQTKYPLLSHFDKDVNPTFDIMFAPCDFYYYDFGNKTNNTAYNLRWRRTLSQMNTGKMLIAYFGLDEYDISKMRLSDKIQVGNAWYNINKIEYNAADVEPTKVELITVDYDLAFVPFKTRIPSLPAIGDTILNPIRNIVGKTKDFANVVLTAAVISVRGVNNVVNQSVKAGVIYGDNNQMSAEKALIVGDNMTMDVNGIATENLKVTGDVDFCTLGVRMDHIYSCTGTITMHDAVDFDNMPTVAGSPWPTYTPSARLVAWDALNVTGLLVQTGVTTWVSRTLTAPAAGITVTNGNGVSGNPTLALANDLAALEGLAGTGIAVRTATDTWAQRSITAPAAGITITNPAGIAGNPTLVLANDLNALENLASTGFAARTATDTWAQRTMTGTASQITVTNGNGVSGNPTFSLDPSIVTGAGLWQVQASGIVLAGNSNSMTGIGTQGSTVTGNSNTIIASGLESSNASTIVGGLNNNITDSDYSTILGGQNVSVTRYAEVATSCNGTKGQIGTWTAFATTTAATVTELFATGTERFTVATGETYHARVTVVCRRSTGTSLSHTQDVLIKNVSGTVGVVGLGTAVQITDMGAMTVTIDADNTNKSLRIRGTGVFAQTHNWFAKVEYTKVV